MHDAARESTSKKAGHLHNYANAYAVKGYILNIVLRLPHISKGLHRVYPGKYMH